MIFGVQHLVAYAHLRQNAGEPLALLYRDGADEDGLTGGMALLDLFGRVTELFVFRPVDHVLAVFADREPVRRDVDDVQLVGLAELGRFGIGGTRHTRELLVHAEEVLEGDRGEGLVLVLDLDAFFGFDGLMQAIAPTAAGHQAAGELVDDDDFAFLHQIVLVAMEQDISFEALLDVVVDLDVFGIVEVGDAEQPFHLAHAVFGERDTFAFFVHGEVAGEVLFAGLLAFNHFAARELGDDAVDAIVLVGGAFAGP